MTAQTPIKIDWTVTKATDPLRLQWAEAACLALRECDPQDAAAICAAFLDTTETGGPRHDVYGTLYSDALWWAEMAPPHELVAYVTAGLDRLPKAHLSTPRRKEVFKHLWRSFTDTDRAAFLAHVKGGK
jgi:hypothetical protein